MKRNLEEVKDLAIESLEIGQKIEGIYITRREGTHGPIFDIEDEDSEETKSLFGKTILNTKMDQIPVGSFVVIERLEDKKTSNGRVAQNFKVLFEKNAEN